jgi:hypothetical protein
VGHGHGQREGDRRERENDERTDEKHADHAFYVIRVYGGGNYSTKAAAAHRGVARDALVTARPMAARL